MKTIRDSTHIVAASLGAENCQTAQFCSTLIQLKAFFLNIVGMLFVGPLLAELVMGSLQVLLIHVIGTNSFAKLAFGLIASAITGFGGIWLLSLWLRFFQLGLTWWPVGFILAQNLYQDWLRVRGAPEGAHSLEIGHALGAATGVLAAGYALVG